MTIAAPADLINNGFEVTTTDWSLTASADNAAATVSRAAEAGKAHYVTSISGGFSAAATKLLTLSDNAVVVGNFYVVNSNTIVFATPVKVSAGALSVSLAASGTAAVLGAVTVTGFTA